MRHEVGEIHCQDSDGSGKEELGSGGDGLLICRARTRIGRNPAQLRVQHGRNRLDMKVHIPIDSIEPSIPFPDQNIRNCQIAGSVAWIDAAIRSMHIFWHDMEIVFDKLKS
jgi:hypothetical protein